MPVVKIIYQSQEEVLGRHLRSKQWIMYSGRLTIYERKINPVVLILKSENIDSFIGEFLEDKKEFKGESVTSVYSKMSKWYYNNGIIFQH
jgi:hypothetical protein